jgi:hypothetical protein
MLALADVNRWLKHITGRQLLISSSSHFSVVALHVADGEIYKWPKLCFLAFTWKQEKNGSKMSLE